MPWVCMVVDMKREKLKKVLENDCDNMKLDLSYAALSYMDLSYADLSQADLSHADLRGVDLSHADLCYADLSHADLRGADLSHADLRYADLCYADLRYANLHYVNLNNAENVPFIPYTCPDFGKFIGYKKASGYIVELEIPEDAKRLSATTRKCRCNKAKVLRILNYDRTAADVTEVRSDYNSAFIYKVGDIVSVDDFDEYRYNECSAGIHFFINFQEAVDY